jgi:UDP-N-acetylglucosamine--N-acetylmuramyl-(pentapeptide) pyrophosphoryl-undecaprenol N-acetylglucosamine transferase
LIRIINYAINGIGVGHITRLRAIAKWLRTLAPDYGFQAEIIFVTTSEADFIVARDGFPVFKMPSQNLLRRSVRSRKVYEQTVRKCVASIIETLAPSLLIVDSAPSGSFGEFLPFDETDILKSCGHKAFILRPMRASMAAASSFQEALRQYDLILVPEAHKTATIHISVDLRDRVEWCGPIVSCERSKFLDRPAALKSLGITERGLHIYISTGGGGHRDAESRIEAICDALQRSSDVQLLVGAGPLYRGRRWTQPNLIWLDSLEMASHLSAVDIAISSAGYNSFNELMFAGVPTIFVPLEAAADDQLERARRAERAGAAVVVSEPSEEQLQATIELWRDEERRGAISAAARSLVPKNCAQIAARQLLKSLKDSNSNILKNTVP